MIMKIFNKDSESNQITEKEIEVSECFKNSKDVLEDIIKRFDNELRTKVSGKYSLVLHSPYLTADSVAYSLSIEDDHNELEVKSSIERDQLRFIE